MKARVPLTLDASSIIRRALFSLGALALLLIVSIDARGEDGPAARTLQRWGYCLIDSFETDGPLPHPQTSIKNLSVLSVTGYKLGSDGRVHGPSPRAQRRIAALASQSDLRILPLVAFTSSSQGRRLLASPSAREKASEALVALTRKGVYAGLHLDFEYLPPEDAPKLAGFLKELRTALNGRKLTMAVFPPLDFPTRWSGFHNLDLIGPLLDEIVLMCYDYHRPGTPAGPIVDLQWARHNVARVLQSVRPGKVWLGMPAYGYAWSTNGKTRVLSARAGVKLAERHHAVRHPSGTIHFRYSDRHGVHEVYLADQETRRRMEELAASLHLKGVALWRLGFEEQP